MGYYIGFEPVCMGDARQFLRGNFPRSEEFFAGHGIQLEPGSVPNIDFSDSICVYRPKNELGFYYNSAFHQVERGLVFSFVRFGAMHFGVREVFPLLSSEPLPYYYYESEKRPLVIADGTHMGSSEYDAVSNVGFRPMRRWFPSDEEPVPEYYRQRLYEQSIADKLLEELMNILFLKLKGNHG